MDKLSPQNKIILAWLKEKRSITTVEAAKELFILRLSERIRELKKMGYDILSERVKGKMYQRYTLRPSLVYRPAFLAEKKREVQKIL